MSPREHARLARELISACGGLDEASRNCRVCKSKLSDYQNPGVVAFMPADVMAALEGYCGEALYSRALFECIGAPHPTGDVLKEASETTEAAALLQHRIRLVTSSGKRPTPRELDELAANAAETKREAEEACAAIERLRAG